jgi:hypothetical protein
MHDLVRRSGWGVSLFAMVLAAAPACALCPLNQGEIGVLQHCASPQSTEPVFSMVPPDCFNGTGSVSYDLIAGIIDVSTYSRSHEGFETWMQTTDDFVVDGPASTTPIGFTALFTVDVYGGIARLSSGADQVSTSPSGGFRQALRLDLSKLPGEHFTVGMYALAAAVLSGDESSGVLRFTTLPAGYALRSCQGYSALPVPVRTTSWGQIKQIYR